MSSTDSAQAGFRNLLQERVPGIRHRRSERALDATAFFLADVADGMGPFLTIYLTQNLKWSSGDAGLAQAAMLLGSVMTQAITGALIDQTRHKRIAIFSACLCVAVATLSLQVLTGRSAILMLQFFTGAAVTVFPTAMAAVSLGLVGRDRLPSRAGRNEACFHAGNVASAGLAAIFSWQWGSVGVFYGVALMAICSGFCVLLIRERDINHELARGADSKSGTDSTVPWWSLFQRPQIIWFALSVILFHFANAAMLPLAGQKVSVGYPQNGSTIMAACIIVAQLTMIPVALWASYRAQFSRKPVMLVAFAVLPIRGVLYSLTDRPELLIANQILDGIGAGVFGVAALLIMADLTRGTGRFNFAQGIVATGISLGAALSNYVTGVIVDHRGFNSGFLFLSGIALIAAVVFFFSVQESGSVAGRVELSPIPDLE